MIQLSTLPIPGVIDAPRGPGFPLAPGFLFGDFALALAGITVPKAGEPVALGVSHVGQAAPIAAVERQALAVGGTILPVVDETGVPDGDVAVKIARTPRGAVRPCDIKLLPDLPTPSVPRSDDPLVPVDKDMLAEADAPEPAPGAAMAVLPVSLPPPIAMPASPVPPAARMESRTPVATPILDPAATVAASVSTAPIELPRTQPLPASPPPAAAASEVTPMIGALIRQSLATADAPRASVAPASVPAVEPLSPQSTPLLPAAPGAEPLAVQPVPPVAEHSSPIIASVIPTPIAKAALAPTIVQAATAVVVTVAEMPTPRQRHASTRPVSAPATPPTVMPQQPAGQVFAAAMFASERPGITAERDTSAIDIAAAVPLSGSSAMSNGPTLAVPAAAGAREPLLDLAHGDWMGSMIDHIETLRDAGGARETRLRLSPDALGSVDIAISHDETGTIQIRIAADTPQARTILAEAAPKLADMAEARGLKLGGGGADANFAGQPQRHTPSPSAPVPARPAAAEDDDSTDTRIA